MAKAAKKNAVAKIKQNASDGISMFRGALASYLGWSHSGRRDLYEAFGYDRSLDVRLLVGMYQRNDIANRIIKAFPQATWRDMPIICDEDGKSAVKDADDYSPFTLACEEFFEKFACTHYLERVDRISSLGRFGILLLGFMDGKAGMDKPARSGKNPLLYLAAYGEPSVTVDRYVTDTTDPRFGLPLMYRINTFNIDDMRGKQSPTKSFLVHYSRVIHIAETLDMDEVYGTPRLTPVYNRLMDLEKVVGGAAESYWLSANRGLALWADKDAGLGEEERKAIRKQADEMSNQMVRTIVGQGMTAQVLDSSVPDPQFVIDRIIQLIGGAVGIPTRILTGTERGELSSSQDENNWMSRIDERRKNFAGPRLLRQFVQKMIDSGNLPAPNGKFKIEWPDVPSNPADEATIANSKAQAIATYSNAPNAPMVVPVQEFRKDVLGLPPESEYEAEPFEDPLAEVEYDPITGEPIESDNENAPPGEAEDGDERDEEDGPASDDAPAAKANAQLTSLYAFRPLLNSEDIIKWAKRNGFKNIQNDLHVTLCYSKKHVDWLKLAEAWGENDDGILTVAPGGARAVERFDGGAVVLSFASSKLSARHWEMRGNGCSSDYDQYQPHITITYKGSTLNLKKLKPYTGKLVFGPEEFNEIAA